MSVAIMPEVLGREAECGLQVMDAVDRTAGGANDRRIVRRRGNQQQGQALEFLGHAIEYLVDSRLFTKDEREAQDDAEAVQILMRMSRAVFAECAEVISPGRRLKRLAWKVVSRLTGFDRRRG
jgi:hypothetical protein